MYTFQSRLPWRSLLIVLTALLILSSWPQESQAQETAILTDQQLLQRSLQAYQSRDFLTAAMYFQAYIQRNPAPMRTNTAHAAEVQAALDYSVRAVRLALQCRLQPGFECDVNEQGLIVSRGQGLVAPVVIVVPPPEVSPIANTQPPPAGQSDDADDDQTGSSSGQRQIVFDGPPNTNRRNVNASFCSGFDTECNFGNCPVNYKLVFGPYCREGDYSYIEPGLYRVTIYGSGPVIAGATDYGTFRKLYGFGRYDLELPGSYTFCWPGRQPGGYGFETIVQSASTSSYVDRIRIEYLGGC